jgi:hypothetical protein
MRNILVATLQFAADKITTGRGPLGWFAPAPPLLSTRVSSVTTPARFSSMDRQVRHQPHFGFRCAAFVLARIAAPILDFTTEEEAGAGRSMCTGAAKHI